MNLNEAKELLNKSEREKPRWRTFGDSEICWMLRVDDETVIPIAVGYFGSSTAYVTFPESGHSFDGDEARELRDCGAKRQISRNDCTGPDIYEEGIVMPKLTLEGVLKELTEN